MKFIFWTILRTINWFLENPLMCQTYWYIFSILTQPTNSSIESRLLAPSLKSKSDYGQHYKLDQRVYVHWSNKKWSHLIAFRISHFVLYDSFIIMHSQGLISFDLNFFSFIYTNQRSTYKKDKIIYSQQFYNDESSFLFLLVFTFWSSVH